VDIIDIYQSICKSSEVVAVNKAALIIRSKYLTAPIVKVAFDTRHVDQEHDFIPRRNLQEYHNSQAFISENLENKIKNLLKLKDIVVSLRDKYGALPEWQDSYLRVLCNSIERCLRVSQKDGDITNTQPGSITYLEELLYLRYRIVVDQILDTSEETLVKILLNHDPQLRHHDSVLADTYKEAKSTNTSVKTTGNTKLADQILGGIQLNSENLEVERVTTIVIKEKIK
jgi:hypothetical protein